MDWWVYKRIFIRFWDNIKPLCDDLWVDVKDILKETFKHFPRHLYRFVVKMNQYAVILWDDVDYDYASLLDLMQYKISRIRKHISTHKIIADWEKVCKQMQEAEELIKLIREDEWTTAEDAEHDLKWGKAEHCTIPIPGKMCSEWRTQRLNVRTKDDEAQERKEFQNIMKLMVKRREKAWNRLWEIMSKYSRSWWD